MTRWGCVLLCALAGTTAAVAQEARVSVSIVAVRATEEGREEKSVEASLREIQESLVALPYDTFTRMTSARADVAYGQEREFAIDRRYSVIVHPIERDSGGRVRLKVRVEEHTETPDGEPRERTALEVTRSAVAGKSLTLCGLGSVEGDGQTGGELVLVVTVRPVGK